MAWPLLDDLVSLLAQDRLRAMIIALQNTITTLSDEETFLANDTNWPLLSYLEETVAQIQDVAVDAATSLDAQVTQGETEVANLSTQLMLVQTEAAALLTQLTLAQSEIAELKRAGTGHGPVRPVDVPLPPASTRTTPSPAAVIAIDLRDWLTESHRIGTLSAAQLASKVDQDIGRILAHEGVVTLDKPGRFDPRRHFVCGKQITQDADADETVASTYSPGYQVNGKLLRQQKIILYSFEEKP